MIKSHFFCSVYFTQGLQDICFENQPNFSLVSNGVEVIMINKKFYTENMTNNQLVRLREHVRHQISLSLSLSLSLSVN